VFFTLLPLSGVAVATWIHTVHTDPAAHWWETPIADEVALFIPVGLGALLLGRLAQKEVTFFTDEPDEEEERGLKSLDTRVVRGGSTSTSWRQAASMRRRI
jgi:hypothetical protein